MIGSGPLEEFDLSHSLGSHPKRTMLPYVSFARPEEEWVHCAGNR
jgi:hypothetical protein